MKEIDLVLAVSDAKSNIADNVMKKWQNFLQVEQIIMDLLHLFFKINFLK